MGRIEKTIFISYRRTNFYTALAVYQDLTAHGYDVFFDYQSIDSGDFEKIITENIRAKAHFLIVLSPSALERCNKPGDWLRREIELAMDEKRNIVPLMMEGFDFGNSSVKQALSGKLATLNKYNGLRLVADYFFEAMEKLRGRFLNVSLEDVPLSPVSAETKEITETRKISVNEAASVEINELTAEEWFERGYIYAESNNCDEAIRCYTKAISMQPDFAEAYVSRGAEYGEKGDLDKAISDFHEGIRLQPDYARAYNNLGVALHSKSKLSDSVKSFTESIRLEPDYAYAFSNRATVYVDLGNYVDAINDCTKAIKIDPNLSEAYNNRGVAFDHAGDVKQAIKDFTEAIRLKPDYADAYRNRGNARDEKGNSKSAIRDYTKAITLKPDFANAYYDRGIAYYNIGNLDAAVKDFTQAIIIKPDFANAYKNRGIIFELQNQVAAAIADYQKYLATGGDDKSVNLLIKNLKEAKEEEIT